MALQVWARDVAASSRADGDARSVRRSLSQRGGKQWEPRACYRNDVARKTLWICGACFKALLAVSIGGVYRRYLAILPSCEAGQPGSSPRAEPFTG